MNGWNLSLSFSKMSHKNKSEVATGENELCVNLIVLTHFVNIYHQWGQLETDNAK